MSQASKDRYEWYKAHHICPRCGQADAAPGRTLCFDCLEKDRERNLKRYYELSDAEKETHLKKESILNKERYKRHKENGICVRCLKKATHGLYCYEHSIREKRKSSERSQTQKLERHERGLIPKFRKENKLCLWCASPLREEDNFYCSTCMEKKRKYAANASQYSPWKQEIDVFWKSMKG